MSRIRADRIVDRAATGAPLFPNGAVVTGVATATTFDGNVTSATTAQGLTGTPAITVGNVVGAAATFSGNVSVGGTLTYEDVTNVESVGIITAQSGIHVGAGVSAVGIITATGGVQVGTGQSFGANGPTAVYYGDGSNLTGAFDIRDTWLYGGG